MDVYYLYNSGFSIELDGNLIVIDYFRGSFGKPWRTPSPRRPSEYGRILVLASHSHRDHYNPRIFSWRGENPSVSYVLSDDIEPPRGGSGEACCARLRVGGEAIVGGDKIVAYGSTDQGISFIVQSGGLSIFHAGDLNCWHWADESTAAEANAAKAAFARELGRIEAGVPKIDVAFFPVDPRQGSDYWRGAVMFCEKMRPTYFFPMHFQDNFEQPQAFEEISQFTKLQKINGELQRSHLEF
jgi:L-ascorbate metabolism protein UlaG (beta-lactamase superfamily)